MLWIFRLKKHFARFALILFKSVVVECLIIYNMICQAVVVSSVNSKKSYKKPFVESDLSETVHPALRDQVTFFSGVSYALLW